MTNLTTVWIFFLLAYDLQLNITPVGQYVFLSSCCSRQSCSMCSVVCSPSPHVPSVGGDPHIPCLCLVSLLCSVLKAKDFCSVPANQKCDGLGSHNMVYEDGIGSSSCFLWWPCGSNYARVYIISYSARVYIISDSARVYILSDSAGVYIVSNSARVTILFDCARVTVLSDSTKSLYYLTLLESLYCLTRCHWHRT